ETARGRVLSGEGVQSLARAFFYAGARSVVASLWSVNDRKTADLMAAFYRHLGSGQGKAQALRSAKLEFLPHRESSSPPSWAPFALIGEPSEPIPLSADRFGPSFLLLIVLLAAATLLLAALARRTWRDRERLRARLSIARRG